MRKETQGNWAPLLRKHPKILFFCFTLLFWSNTGQTYFISWFNPFLMETYGASRTTIGAIYSLATLFSSFFLPSLGGALDRLRPMVFGVILVLCLATGFVTLSFAAGLFGVFMAFFIIRLFGQTGPSLLAQTLISRKFGKHRGKALSYVQMGRSLGEACLPGIIVSLLGVLGLAQAALVCALGLFALLMPVVVWCCRNLDFKQLYGENEQVAKAPDHGPFSRKKFYEDRPIFMVLFVNCLFPFIATGLFFQQASFAQMKGWSETAMQQGFIIYGSIGPLFVLLSGRLIDRFTATKILALPLLPILAAIAVLLFGQGKSACFIYLGLLSMTAGMAPSIMSSFYAENFPYHQLGKVKGVNASYFVKASALAPFVFSYALDLEVKLGPLVGALGILTCTGVLIAFKASGIYQKRHSLKTP